MQKVDKDLAMGDARLTPISPDGKMDEPRYPTFHYEGPEEIDIPSEGKMLVEYCQKNVVEIKTNGKHWYKCDVEIRKVISAEEADEVEAPSRRDTSTEDALDALMEEREENEANE
jgi:hypothetical protein